jgi:hypothetical protein
MAQIRSRAEQEVGDYHLQWPATHGDDELMVEDDPGRGHFDMNMGLRDEESEGYLTEQEELKDDGEGEGYLDDSNSNDLFLKDNNSAITGDRTRDSTNVIRPAPQPEPLRRCGSAHAEHTRNNSSNAHHLQAQAQRLQFLEQFLEPKRSGTLEEMRNKLLRSNALLAKSHKECAATQRRAMAVQKVAHSREAENDDLLVDMQESLVAYKDSQNEVKQITRKGRQYKNERNTVLEQFNRLKMIHDSAERDHKASLLEMEDSLASKEEVQHQLAEQLIVNSELTKELEEMEENLNEARKNFHDTQSRQQDAGKFFDSLARMKEKMANKLEEKHGYKLQEMEEELDECHAAIDQLSLQTKTQKKTIRDLNAQLNETMRNDSNNSNNRKQRSRGQRRSSHDEKAESDRDGEDALSDDDYEDSSFASRGEEEDEDEQSQCPAPSNRDEDNESENGDTGSESEPGCKPITSIKSKQDKRREIASGKEDKDNGEIFDSGKGTIWPESESKPARRSSLVPEDATLTPTTATAVEGGGGEHTEAPQNSQRTTTKRRSTTDKVKLRKEQQASEATEDSSKINSNTLSIKNKRDSSPDLRSISVDSNNEKKFNSARRTSRKSSSLRMVRDDVATVTDGTDHNIDGGSEKNTPKEGDEEDNKRESGISTSNKKNKDKNHPDNHVPKQKKAMVSRIQLRVDRRHNMDHTPSGLTVGSSFHSSPRTGGGGGKASGHPSRKSLQSISSKYSDLVSESGTTTKRAKGKEHEQQGKLQLTLPSLGAHRGRRTSEGDDTLENGQVRVADSHRSCATEAMSTKSGKRSNRIKVTLPMPDTLIPSNMRRSEWGSKVFGSTTDVHK